MSAKPSVSSSPSILIDLEVHLAMRDHMSLSLEVDAAGMIIQSRLSGSGCPDLLEALRKWRPLMQGELTKIPLPKGAGHVDVLLRELLLKATGQWSYPYQEEELCHCRAVALKTVDDSIVGGCHTVEAVARATSAGTSCGTCRTDTKRIIDYRLGRSS
jgi:bacterioferritin-associated ferredoxin